MVVETPDGNGQVRLGLVRSCVVHRRLEPLLRSNHTRYLENADSETKPQVKGMITDLENVRFTWVREKVPGNIRISDALPYGVGLDRSVMVGDITLLINDRRYIVRKIPC